MGTIQGDAWDSGSVHGVDGLVIDGFIVRVAVELSIERQVVIVKFVVLMSFNVREDEGDMC